MGIESGPLKHKDIVVDKIKKIFKPSKKDDSAYLQSPVIDKVKPKPTKPKESGTNTYAKDNQTAIKKLKA
jgi:hypothetical protein